MDIKNKKCSNIEHSEINANVYCTKCEIFLCNKCENIHSKMCNNHKSFIMKQDSKEIFTGYCKEEKHQMELEYFCKTHNQLCCAACIAKLQKKENGKHKDCDICFIEDIKEEKKSKLKENINCLEKLSNTLQESINKLKLIFEDINKNKEELKLQIQKTFTTIRNELNNREDELLLEVDKKFESLFFKEDIIKESEKLPNKIKISLEKSKLIDKYKDNELSFLINECLNIETNIQEINSINKYIIKGINSNNIKIKFNIEEGEKNKFFESVHNFGKITELYNTFRFKQCPENISQERKYVISGENQNIFTKTGNGSWAGTICENELEKNKEHSWKIKVLNTQGYNFSIGVAPIDFDINSSTDTTCGWYLYCSGNTLFSGPPHKFNGKATNLNAKKDEIKVVLDMNKRTLKFIIDNEDKGESYTDIPVDKPLFPAVLLCNANDSVQILP